MRRHLPLPLLLLSGCAPVGDEVVLDLEADRHFSTGDVHRIPDGDCTGPVTADVEGAATVRVSNQYLETDIAAVLVAPDCEESGWLDLAPGEEDFSALSLPSVIRIYAGDALLSAWTIYYPLDGGQIVVQP